MNIIFVTIAWPSTGEKNLYTDLMNEFVLHGHNIYVVCTSNAKDTKFVGIRKENGIHVLRTSTGSILKTSYFRKAWSLLRLTANLNKTILKYLNGIHFELIIASTPPVTLSPLYYKLKKRYNIPLYLLLKDIWPQGSVDLKVFKKYSLIWAYLRYHEIRTYKASDYIGTMSPMNVQYLLSKNKFLSPQKVEVCPNSIQPTDLYLKHCDGDIRKKFGIPFDACVFLFSGNLGKGHGLSFLVEAIKNLSNFSKAFFIIGGSGTHYNMLKKALCSETRKNAYLYNWLPRNDFELVLKTSNVGLILLDNKYTIPQFPSRLLSYLDLSIPILCAANDYTDIGKIIETSCCGKYIQHGDLLSFMNEIKWFSINKEARTLMGNNARKLLMDCYTVSGSYNIIIDHFDKIDN